MSRIGKLPITIPAGVEYALNGNVVSIKGKKGTLTQDIDLSSVTLSLEDNILTITRASEAPDHRSKHGLYRALIQNMIVGVTDGFKKEMEVVGVGYRANVQAKSLVLNLGYSHPVNIDIPDGINVEVVQNTTLNIKACDKEQLGLFAAKVRSWRPPEPYKGKGILYKGEKILRKAGKSGKK